MIYEIRLKAREKQAQCSMILLLSFFVILLSVVAVNLLPIVYMSILKPLLSGNKIISVILSVGFVLCFVVTYSALSFGADRFMLKRAENIAAGAGDIFYYFAPKRLISLCGFNAYFALRKLIIIVFLSLPFLCCSFICISLCKRGFSAAVCYVFAGFSVLFFLLMISSYYRINDTFFLVRYKFIKGDYISMKHLFAVSQQSMMSQVKSLRLMKMSFTGWFLLCLFIFTIPYVWSYYRQSKACFAVEKVGLM